MVIIGEIGIGSSSRTNDIKGNIHQHLAYDRALTTDEITTIACELVSLHVGNV